MSHRRRKNWDDDNDDWNRHWSDTPAEPYAGEICQIHTNDNWNGHMMKRGATAAAAIIMVDDYLAIVDDFDCEIISLNSTLSCFNSHQINTLLILDCAAFSAVKWPKPSQCSRRSQLVCWNGERRSREAMVVPSLSDCEIDVAWVKPLNSNFISWTGSSLAVLCRAFKQHSQILPNYW